MDFMSLVVKVMHTLANEIKLNMQTHTLSKRSHLINYFRFLHNPQV